MAFDVRMIITGVCAYVPDRPLGDLQNPPEKLRVILPDGRQGMTIGRAEICEHTPFLRVLPANVGQTDLKVDVEDDLFKTFRLDRKLLAFALTETRPQANDFLIHQGLRKKIRPQPLGDDIQDITWVPQLDRIAPGFADIAADCLRPMKPPAEVVSHLIVNRGKVGTHFGPGSQWHKLVWDFTSLPAGKSYRQAFSSQVEVIFEDLESFRIEVTSLDDPGSQQFLELHPAHGEDDITFAVGNLCEKGLKGLGIGNVLIPDPVSTHVTAVTHAEAAKASSVQKVPDLDTQLVYRLLADRTGFEQSFSQLGAPVPQRGGLPPGFVGDPSARCFGMFFAAHS